MKKFYFVIFLSTFFLSNHLRAEGAEGAGGGDSELVRVLEDAKAIALSSLLSVPVELRSNDFAKVYKQLFEAAIVPLYRKNAPCVTLSQNLDLAINLQACDVTKMSPYLVADEILKLYGQTETR